MRIAAVPVWIGTTDAAKLRPGDLFGWVDRESPTGLSSGYVVESDPMHLRVRVHDVAPGVLKQ